MAHTDCYGQSYDTRPKCDKCKQKKASILHQRQNWCALCYNKETLPPREIEAPGFSQSHQGGQQPHTN